MKHLKTKSINLFINITLLSSILFNVLVVPVNASELAGINYEGQDYIKLDKYKIEDIQTELESYVQEDIRQYVDTLLEKYPDYKLTDKVIPEVCDYVKIGLIGYVDNEKSPSINYPNCIIKLNHEILPHEIEETILNLAVSESKIVNIQSETYREEYKGYNAEFLVTLVGIVEPTIYTYNTVTESYVKQFFNVSSLDEFYYKAEAEALKNKKEYKQNALYSYLNKNTIINIPDNLVTKRAYQNLELFKKNNFNNEADYKKYIKNTYNDSKKHFITSLKEEAYRNVKLDMILDYLYNQLKLDNDDYYKKYLKSIKKAKNVTDEELFDYYKTFYESGESYVRRMSKNQQVIDYYMDYDVEISNIKTFDKKWIPKIIPTIGNDGSKTFVIPNARNFKSFMSYKAITSKNSTQYKLQQIAESSYVGLRTINGRYCIALGTGFNAQLGQYCDLILENGTKIECIFAEVKSNKDTDESNIFTNVNGCCSEFIVDCDYLPSNVLLAGSVSKLNADWDSPVCKIVVYDKCIEIL